MATFSREPCDVGVNQLVTISRNMVATELKQITQCNGNRKQHPR